MAIQYVSSMPYDDVSIIDRTGYVEPEVGIETIDTVPSGPIMYCPFVSPRGYGEDGKLMYMNANILSKFGTPNLRKYGLSLYLANRFIEGGGTVLGKRLVSDDATYANSIVYATKTAGGELVYKVKREADGKYYPLMESTTGTADSQYGSETISIETNGQYNEEDLEEVTSFRDIYKNLSSLLASPLCNVTLPSNDNRGLLDVAIGLDRTDEIINRIGDGWVGPFYSPGVNNQTIVSILSKDVYDAAIPASFVSLPSGFVASHRNDVTYFSGQTVVADKAAIVSDSYDKYGLAYIINVKISGVNAVVIEPFAELPKVPAEASIDLSTCTASALKNDQMFTKENFATWAGVDASNVIFSEDDVRPGMAAKVYPLFYIRSKTKGEFANAFAFNLIPDSFMNSLVPVMPESNRDAYFYKFSDKDGTDYLDKTMSFTFNRDYVYMKQSMDVENVFEEYAGFVKFIRCEAYDLFAEDIFGDVKNSSQKPEYFTTDEQWMNSLDFIFGSNLGLDSSYTVNLSNVKFSGGSDGESLNYGFGTANELYVDKFAAAYDPDDTPELNDVVKYPFQYVYAPSTNSEIVNAIHKLITTRNNGFTHARYFCKKANTYSEVVQNFNALTSIDDYREILEGEWYLVQDPYTYRYVYMPNVYMHAYFEPRHWNTNKSAPLAGKNYKITGFKVGSVVPSYASEDDLVNNHNNGINTVLEDGNGYAIPYEQITAQQRAKITSDLSEINNVYSLCEMVKIALNVASNARWTIDFNPTDYAALVKSSIESAIGNTYKSLDVVARRESVNGAGRNRIVCDITVSFNSILKGVTYTFYVVLNEEE